jgi:hypothetical protein
VTDSAEKINPSLPTASRRYDAWLGGKDNFAADRASADAVSRAFPAIRAAVAENRRCLLRMVRYLAAEPEIRQFLDIGCGIPTPQDNVHQIAQQVAPDSRIVYVDNDAMVAVHMRALPVSTPEGAVAFHLGDVRQPKQIMSADVVRGTFDLTRPVAVLLCAVLHFVPEGKDAQSAVRELVAALPAGSYVALSHATFDPLPADVSAALDEFTKPDSGDGPFRPRTHDEIATLLAGLDLVEPGLVSTVHWHPQLEPPADRSLGADEAISYAALAVKR